MRTSLFPRCVRMLYFFSIPWGWKENSKGYLAQYVSPRSDFRSVITCTIANLQRRFKAVGKSCSPVSAHIPLSRVNDARKQMLTQNRRIDNILPTLYAMHQNVKKAAYQAGHIWGQLLIGTPELPPPHMWAWQRETDDAKWIPNWTTLPEAANACHELLKCGCKKSCTNRCKSVKANLQLCIC